MKDLRNVFPKTSQINNEPVNALLLITLSAGSDVDSFVRKLVSDTEADSIYVLEGAPDLLAVVRSESLDDLREKVNKMKNYTDFRGIIVLPVHEYLDCKKRLK